jgi:hypothetical protein
VDQYTDTIETDDGPKKAIMVKIDREDQPPFVASFGGYSFRRTTDAPIVDTLPNIFNARTSLEQRLLANRCEICGATEKIEVHHLRKLADLKKAGRGAKPAWVIRMAELQRKTLVVCADCHDSIHAGKPYQRAAERTALD